jgi:hypothetical protein
MGDVLERREVVRQADFCVVLNLAFNPCRFFGPELDGIRIAGKVVAVYHRVLKKRKKEVRP